MKTNNRLGHFWVLFCDGIDNRLMFPDGFLGRPYQPSPEPHQITEGNDAVSLQDTGQEIITTDFDQKIMKAPVFFGIFLYQVIIFE